MDDAENKRSYAKVACLKGNKKGYQNQAIITRPVSDDTLTAHV